MRHDVLKELGYQAFGRGGRAPMFVETIRADDRSRDVEAAPTWSSMEQLPRPVTKQFHTSDWRALEACCRPWTWWCNDATALAGYATVMMLKTFD